MNIEHEGTFKKALAEGVNLFLGAGFSVLAHNIDNASIPLGAGLKDEITQQFNRKDIHNLDLSQISLIIERTHRNELREFLERRFEVGGYDSRYNYLELINIRTIYTTNIDNLIPKIYSQSSDHYINDVLHRGPTYHDRYAIDYVPLHGSIMHQDKPLTFSSSDIAAEFGSDPDKWHWLTEGLQKFPTLYWGYNLNDASVLQALHPRTIQDRKHKEKWITLHQPSEATIEYFQSMNFYIIVASTDELLEYIDSNFRSSPPPVSTKLKSTHQIFPDLAVPNIGTTSVRPIQDFYTGIGPIWNDIFSGKIVETHHYAEIVNHINMNQNLVVIGVPACGKTTLMMQVAANNSFNAHKLVLDSLSFEKAHLILTKLQGEKAVIFVDNFSDNMAAFGLLLKRKHIIAVGFDRDYAYERASHLIDSRDYKILDVTNLNDRDIQELYQSIPPAIRTTNLIRPRVEEGASISLYELIVQNTRVPTLKDRFSKILIDLKQNNLILHDLLVTICYVRSCRVPVSYDTISAFLRGNIKSYSAVYKLLNQLGSTIIEYVGNLVEDDQDYFTPRSIYASEAVIKNVAATDLRRVLNKFHENVSSIRITRYDVFRREAFSTDMVEQAFTNWREGLEFYQKMYLKDSSPYLLQQCALYLSRKQQFTEAFNWIDRALSENDSFSIRNSHAIILFRASISNPDKDDTVMEMLRRSMEILAECFSADRRRTYHALTFADQAIKISNVFSNLDESLRYLDTARKWLQEEATLQPWNHKITRLQRLVERQISKLS